MAEYLISLSLLICAVLLIRGVFRKTISPRAVYALWLVVVIRMLVPIPLFEVNVTFPALLQNQQTEQMEQLPNDSETTADESLQSPSNSPVQTTPNTPSAIPEEPSPVDWKRIADTIWFIGAGAAAVWVMFTSITYNRRLVKDRRLHRTVRGTKVYVSESAGVPCIAGLIPSIYITPEAANSKSEMLIIIHEHIHLRHGDHIWTIVRALALIVFWWNPLVWAAATVSRQDAELACDDAISAKLNEDGRLKYANILLDTIPQKNRYAVGFGSAPMKERILRLTRKQKNRWICLVLAMVLAVSAVGCSFVSVKGNTNVSDGEASTDQSNEQQDIDPSIRINIDELQNTMEEIETNETFPADIYTINITGLSVPVKLYMRMDSVTAIEAYGHRAELTQPRDIYGNCSFELFEADGAVILEGGYYSIGDVYILSTEKYSEIHPGKESSYWLSVDDSGSLKYRRTHNAIADITQTGALSTAISYDEFLYATGDAFIENGEVIFAEPYESYTMSDKYDLDDEFVRMWSDSYSSIEEIFAANRLAREE